MRRARSHVIERGLAPCPTTNASRSSRRCPTCASHAVRRLLPARAVRPVAGRGLHRDAGRRRRPRAMREHYRAAISNTSIHEAYPGHHLQLALATRHPSLTRVQVDAPEFVEGWGMYSEQPPPGARLRRRARVLAGARHRRDLAGRADRPRRPDAPRRGLDRGGRRLPGGAHGVRAPECPRRGPPLHLHPDLQPVLPARQGPAAGAPRRRAAAPR